MANKRNGKRKFNGLYLCDKHRWHAWDKPCPMCGDGKIL